MVTMMIACKPDTSGTTTQNDTAVTDPSGTTDVTESSSLTSAAQKSTNTMQPASEGTSALSEKQRGSGTNSKEQKPRAAGKTADGQVTNFNNEGIPDACDLLTGKTISKYLKISEAAISLADGSSKKSDLQRACFFKWDDPNMRNAGVMVQVQKNPVADDVPEYFTYMVQSLKSQGETDMAGLNMKYSDWPGHGDDAAYSTKAGKYVWRIGSDWAFMVAFNATIDDSQQKAAAEAFAKEIMSKMSL